MTGNLQGPATAAAFLEEMSVAGQAWGKLLGWVCHWILCETFGCWWHAGIDRQPTGPSHSCCIPFSGGAALGQASGISMPLNFL